MLSTQNLRATAAETFKTHINYVLLLKNIDYECKFNALYCAWLFFYETIKENILF